MAYINYEQKDGVGIVTFSRPEALNALSAAGIAESLQFFEGLGKRLSAADAPEVHAVLLTGAGKAFIAGADVKEMSLMNPAEAARFSQQGNRLMSEIERLPIPVIAAVNGYALGGGFEVALAADFIYAATDAKLGLPEVTLGIIPGFGGVRRLSWRIGIAKAKELIYTGRLVTAQEAFELGIVSRVVALEGLLDQARQTAALIGNAGPLALQAAKRLANECILLDASAAAAVEAERFGALFAGSEPSERMHALLEKRKPGWARKDR
jgi:enoyl-CoA hydratase